jgi:hypothetical protein
VETINGVIYIIFFITMFYILPLSIIIIIKGIKGIMKYGWAILPQGYVPLYWGKSSFEVIIGGLLSFIISLYCLYDLWFNYL